MTKSEFLVCMTTWFKKLTPDGIAVITCNGGPTYKKLFVEFDHEYTTDEGERSADPLLSTAETLAIAVLSGDSSAADPLVDYLQENGMDAIAEAKRQERERVVNKMLATLDSQVEFYKRIRGVMTGSQVSGLLHRIMLHI